MHRINYLAFIFISTLLVPGSISFAQQHPLFTQYMFNGLLINPAYAGSHESMNLTTLVRKQWTGFEGSPATQTFSVHSPLKNERVALGVIAMNDVIGAIRQRAVYGAFAYRIPAGEEGKISFGLQAGIDHRLTNLNSLNAKHIEDPLLISDLISESFINYGTGIYYFNKRFYSGFSIPRLLNQGHSHNRQLFYTSGYVLKLSPDFKLKPSVLLKLMTGVPAQADFNCHLLFREVLSMGVSFRTFSSINILAQIQLNDQLRVGYAYDNQVNRLATVLRGSHEIMLSYNFRFFGSNNVSPRYF